MFQSPWIHGELSNGQHVTLLAPTLIESRFGSSAGGVRSLTYSCSKVLAGEVSFYAPPVKFQAVRLSLKWLQTWLDEPAVRRQFADNAIHLEIRNLPSKVFTAPCNGELFEIILKQEGWVHPRVGETTAKQKTSLSIVPREERDLEWFLEQEHKLWALISFITGLESEVTSFSGIHFNETFAWEASSDFCIDVDLPDAQKQRVIRIESLINMDRTAELYHTYQVFSKDEGDNVDLLTTSHGSPPFATIVSAWYTWSAVLRQVASLVIAATRQDDYYIESRLANLAQAAEAAHRELHPDRTALLPKDEFRRLSKEFKSWLQEKVDPASSAALAGKFGNLNAISLPTRLEELFNPLWDSFIKIRCLSPAPIDLAKEIGVVRNNIAHANAGAEVTVATQRYLLIRA